MTIAYKLAGTLYVKMGEYGDTRTARAASKMPRMRGEADDDRSKAHRIDDGEECDKSANSKDHNKMPPDFVYSISLIRGLLVSRDRVLHSTVIVASTAAVEWIGYQVPERYEDERADQCSNQWDRRTRGNVDITDPSDNDNLCHQPDANQRGNNCADETERQTPSYEGLGYETHDSSHDQVHNEVQTESPDVVTNFNGYAVCKNE